jgi:antitoxin YefM
MDIVSYTDLRANLAKIMDEVCDNKDVVVVTRQNARSVVLMSEEEYEGMMETLHLLRSPANAERLMRSIAAADAGHLEEHQLVEPETGAMR